MPFMMRHRRGFARSLSVAMAAILCGFLHGPVHAGYPERPVTFIVPFAPGGPTDIIGRILAGMLSKKLGQQFIVDNRSGASGDIGMGAAARAKPDGYVLLVTSTAIAVNPARFGKLAYDPFKSFAPISELVNAPNVFIVRGDSRIRTMADLVAYAKSHPESTDYAHPGVGTKSQLAAELLNQRAGIAMVGVPYRGAGPAVQAVLEGTTPVSSVALASAEGLIHDGKVHALAVTSAKRWFSLPNVPTMVEAGFKGFVSNTFTAVLAPAGTSHEVVALLVKECRAAFTTPEGRELAHKAGFEVVAGTPDQLIARIKAEIAEVRELVRRAGLKPK